MSLLSKITNYMFPTSFNNQPRIVRDENVKAISNYISPVQFQRLKVDIAAWRDAVKEAEQAFYPHRVKMQRIYIDTILNGQVDACMNKRKNLTLLKGFSIKNGDKVDEKATELLNKQWFFNLLNYILDAKFYGYTLIGLNEVVDNQLPNLEVIKRWNVSPDRYQLVPLVYSLSGINFLDPEAKDKDGNLYYDWTIYIDTPSETGASVCGYGLLYKVALYEIYIRNNMGYNATALELFGQPLRVGKTAKTDEYERAEYERALRDMGSSGYVLLDLMDELELVEGSSQSGKNMGFANLEERCNKMISKIILGHADAMDSVSGKLGAEDSALEAIEQVEKADTAWLETVINTKVLPKLINLGLPIPLGTEFCFSNDKEVIEAQKRKDEEIKQIADIALTFKNAGVELPIEWIEERTGIKVTKTELIDLGISQDTKDRIKNLYGVK